MGLVLIGVGPSPPSRAQTGKTLTRDIEEVVVKGHELSALITVPSTSFTATGLQNGIAYYAVLRSVDFAGNESGNLQEVSTVPGP